MRIHLTTWVALAFVSTTSRTALALSACASVDIINQEGHCPPAGDCTIANQYTVPDGCTLDFSGRNVTLAPTAVLTIGAGKVTLLTKDLILAASASTAARIDSRGTGSSPPADYGGDIIINASGDVSIQKNGNPRARIDVSATQDAGSIQITAAGAVTVAGRLAAGNEPNATTAAGGEIDVRAGADIVTQDGCQIRAGSGEGDAYSGRINFTAGGAIDLGEIIDVSGGFGGDLALTADGDVVVRGVNGNGNGGFGATVHIEAGRNAQLLASPIYLNGIGGSTFELHAQRDLTIAASVLAQTTMPGAGENAITIWVEGNVTVAPATRLSTHSYPDRGGGSGIDLSVGGALVMAGSMDAGGEPYGGYIHIDVTGDARITGPIDISSIFGLSYGVRVKAGGDLLISSVIQANGGRCDGYFCGTPSEIELRGRNVTLTRQAQVLSRGPRSGGDNSVAASGQLIIDGVLDARVYGSFPAEYDGSTVLAFSCGAIHGSVLPPPQAVPTPCEPTPVIPPTNTAAPVESPTSTPLPTAICGVACTVKPSSTPTHTPPSEPTLTASPTQTPLPSPTATEEVVPTGTATPTLTATPPCTGDCTLDGKVTVDELLFMVNIALGTEALSGCPVGDVNHDHGITIDEILQAANLALFDCP